jgi:hypothetical protein
MTCSCSVDRVLLRQRAAAEDDVTMIRMGSVVEVVGTREASAAGRRSTASLLHSSTMLDLSRSILFLCSRLGFEVHK